MHFVIAGAVSLLLLTWVVVASSGKMPLKQVGVIVALWAVLGVSAGYALGLHPLLVPGTALAANVAEQPVVDRLPPPLPPAVAPGMLAAPAPLRVSAPVPREAQAPQLARTRNARPAGEQPKRARRYVASPVRSG